MSAEKLIISELLKECEVQAANPPLVSGQSDTYVSEFANALGAGIAASEPAQLDISSAILDKRISGPFSSNLAFNSLLRLFQMRHMGESDYPYDISRTWHQKVKVLLSNEDQRKQLAIDLSIWNVGSDVETRIAGPALVAHTLQSERTQDVDEPFTILNVGSARDHGLSMLTGVLPLPEIDICPASDVPDSAIYKKAVNKLLSRHINLGECYGVDLWPLRDIWWSQYLEACRFYPLELKDPEKRQRYRRLEAIRDADPRLHHTDADFADLDDSSSSINGSLNGLEAHSRYDMVLFSTCLYQNYPEKRRRMFDNAIARLSPTGLVVVQDFCNNTNLDSPHPIDALEFNGPASEPFSYVTMVYNHRQPQKGLVPFVHWNNGRCEIARLSTHMQSVLEVAR